MNDSVFRHDVLLQHPGAGPFAHHAGHHLGHPLLEHLRHDGLVRLGPRQGGVHLPRDALAVHGGGEDVSSKHGGEGGHVEAGRVPEGGEGLVSGSKDGEVTRAGEGLGQASGGDGGQQGGEARVGGGQLGHAADRGQQNLLHHVDHSIVSNNIRLGDPRSVDGHHAIVVVGAEVDVSADGAAGQSVRHHVVADLVTRHRPGQRVVEQCLAQQLRVLGQRGGRLGWQPLERLVGRSEDGEGSGPGKSLSQPGLCNKVQQRRVACSLELLRYAAPPDGGGKGEGDQGGGEDHAGGGGGGGGQAG